MTVSELCRCEKRIEDCNACLPIRTRVAVDWDGTLVQDNGWPGMGEWLPGSIQALKVLADEFDQVVIHSCRIANVDTDGVTPHDKNDQVIKICDMLEAAEIPYNVLVWVKDYKPPAEFYIDNRAIRFEGSWKPVLEKVIGKKTSEVPVAPERHPNSEKFHRYLGEAADLHDLKQSDYGRGDDPFANVRSSSDWGMPAWVGAMVRLNDKVKRLQSLARTGNLSNEGAVDSFMDIAVYALIARVLFEDEASPCYGEG